MTKGRERQKARVGLVSRFGKDLARRSGSCCELCGTCQTPLEAYEVLPLQEEPALERTLFLCTPCLTRIRRPGPPDETYWHFLEKVVWSEFPAVQVVAVRILRHLNNVSWAADLLDELYLQPEIEAWVEAAGLIEP